MTTASHPLADINSGFVYTGPGGELRLVVSVERPTGVWALTDSQRRRLPQAVINWRTADPELPLGLKSQGSATLRSFLRWASSARKATKHDWEAFDAVQRRRHVRGEVRQMKYQIRRAAKVAAA